MPEQRVAVRLSVQNAGYNAGLAQSERSTDKLEAALARLDRQIRAMERRDIRVNASLDSTQLEAELRRLSNRRTFRVDVTARLDTSTWAEEARRAAAALQVTVRSSLGLGTQRLRARIDAEFSSGTEARLQRQLDGMRLSVRVRPNVGPLPTPSAGGGGGGGVGLAGALGGSAAGLVAALPQAVSLLSAAASNATALAGQIGLAAASGAGLVPVLGALGQGFAVASIGSRGVVDALKQYAAIGASGADATPAQLAKLNDILKDLGPNQRAFVREARNTQGVLSDLRGDVGEALFAGAGRSLRQLTTGVLPLFRSELVDTGRIVNQTGRGLVDQLAGPLRERLGGALSLNNDLLAKASPLAGRLLSVALSLYNAVGPLAGRIVDGANGLAKLADESASAGVESGRLVAFFDRAGDRAGELLRGLGNLSGGLRNVFKIGNERSSLLSTFEELAQRFESFTTSVRGERAIRGWFDDGRAAGQEFRGLLGDIATEFQGLSSDVDAASIVGGLRSAVPYVADLVRTLSGGGDTGRIFAQAVLEIAEALDRVNAGNGIAAFVGTLSGLVTLGTDLVGALGPVAPLLGGVAAALGSVAAVNLVAGGLFRLAPALTALASPAGAASLAVGLVALDLFKTRTEARRTSEEIAKLSNLTPLQLIDRQEVADSRDGLNAIVKELEDFERVNAGADPETIDGARWKQLAKAAEGAREGLAKLNTEQANVERVSGEVGTQLGLTSEEFVTLAEKAGAVDLLKAGNVEGARDAIATYKAETAGAAQASRDLAADLDVLGDASTTAGEKADALRRVMQDLDGGILGADEAAIRFQESIDRLSESATTNGTSLDINTAAGQRNRQTIIDAQQALRDRIAADVEAGISGEELRKRVEAGSAQFRDETKAAFGTTDQVMKLIEQYNLTPEEVATKVAVNGNAEAEKVLRDLQGQLRDFNKEYSARIVVTGAYTGITNLGAGAAAAPTLSTNRREGAVVDYYAAGGVRENHVADIAPAGAMRVWAEPETGGEAYIPLAASKRARSLNIWQETGRRLGVQGFADGGINVAVNPDLAGATGGLANVAQVMVQLSKQMIAVADAAASGGSAGTAQGKDAILSFIRSTDPLPYVWGGVGPNGYDCSGLVGEVLNRMIGRKSYNRAFTTASIAAGQYGLKPGTGGTLSIGVTPGSGHMAGEYGGLPFEAESTKTGIKIGAAASSVNSFARKFHLAQGGILDEIAALGRFMDVAGDPSELVINDRLVDSFDRGGEARGTGWMRKDVIAPERTLSPAMTPIFDRFVQQLERTDPSSWVRAPATASGSGTSNASLERVATALERGKFGAHVEAPITLVGTDVTAGDVVSALAWEMR